MAEVLAAELRPDAGLAGQLQHLPFEFEIPKRPAAFAPGGGEGVEGPGAGQLDRLQRQLGRGAADDDRQVVRRAGGGPQQPDLLVEERQQRLGVEQRLGLLEEEGLVGRAAALGDEQELVLVARSGEELDLGGEVGAGVLLLVHRERRQLRVAEIRAGVGVEDALREGGRVVGPGEDVLALVPDHDGGAGVLARRQHPAGRDVGVLQHLQGDEAVVVRRLGIVDDGAQLC